MRWRRREGRDEQSPAKVLRRRLVRTGVLEVGRVLRSGRGLEESCEIDGLLFMAARRTVSLHLSVSAYAPWVGYDGVVGEGVYAVDDAGYWDLAKPSCARWYDGDNGLCATELV